jgi:hypothetical protein
MRFAHWKNIIGTEREVGQHASTRERRQMPRQMVEHLIVDIPEGTTQEDVVEKLLANGVQIGNTDGAAFAETWSEEVRRQCDSQNCDRWSWPNLK